MEPLRIAALDEDDLDVVSAYVQDAIARVGDIAIDPAAKRIAIALNRFVWEKPKRLLSASKAERRRSILQFDRVRNIRASGIDRGKKEEVLNLLSIQFFGGNAPAGEVELIFSGEATIRLEVECIEARLTDTGAAWEAGSRPRH